MSPARNLWLAVQPKLSITSVTWLEVIYGAPGKSGQARSLSLFKQFTLEYIEQADQDWAMTQMLTYRLSRGLEINDCLIASISYRLQVPLYTHNQKDMLKVLPAKLVVLPYNP